MKIPKIQINSEPYITAYNFMLLADHIWIGDDTYNCKSEDIRWLKEKNGIDPEKIEKGDVVYVITDLVERFFNEIHPKITERYILITGRTDKPLENVNRFIDNKIITWYSSNLNDDNPKLVGIPLGMQNPHWRRVNNPEGNIRLIQEINDETIEKESGVLMAFQPHTNPSVRQPIFNQLKEKDFVTVKNYDNSKRGIDDFQKEYYREIRKHKFVVCPWGAGFDCHRNWETWSLGTYPIIKKHLSMENFYDMPAWFIDDWSEVTKNNMDEKYRDIEFKMEYQLNNNYNELVNLRKINSDFWVDMINKDRTFIKYIDNIL